MFENRIQNIVHIPDNLKSNLQIRYVKLHFYLEILEDGCLPENKSSALRGGMGHALLTTECFGDQNCPNCDFSEDCLVRRMMYPEMKIRPAFMQTQDSEGFIIECENHEESFRRGDILSFNILLFGRCIIYFTHYLQAFYHLGMMGLGKQHIHFQIKRVLNTTGDLLVDDMNVFKENLKIYRLEDYVRYRLTSRELCGFNESSSAPFNCRLVFHTPLSLKYKGQMQRTFSPEALLSAAERRLYILNCFEGRAENKDYLRIPVLDYLPVKLGEKVYRENVQRYSGTHHSNVTFSGIRGWCDLSDLDSAALTILLAGEILHIGKNTSFGFGRYTLINN